MYFASIRKKVWFSVSEIHSKLWQKSQKLKSSIPGDFQICLGLGLQIWVSAQSSVLDWSQISRVRFPVYEECSQILPRTKQEQPLGLEKQIIARRLFFLLFMIYSRITPGFLFSLSSGNLTVLIKWKTSMLPSVPGIFLFVYSSSYVSLTILLQPREGQPYISTGI